MVLLIEDPNVFNFNTNMACWLQPEIAALVTFNIGIQRNIKGGLFVSVDYFGTSTLMSLLNHDVNYVGAANTFNATARKPPSTTLQAWAQRTSMPRKGMFTTAPGGRTIATLPAKAWAVANGLYVQTIVPTTASHLRARTRIRPDHAQRHDRPLRL